MILTLGGVVALADFLRAITSGILVTGRESLTKCIT